MSTIRQDISPVLLRVHSVEQMANFVSVPDFFRSVCKYLLRRERMSSHFIDVVDLSPSLCEMARKRFARLGWKNIKVICQDARAFRLHEHEPQAHQRKEIISQGQTVRDLDENAYGISQDEACILKLTLCLFFLVMLVVPNL